MRLPINFILIFNLLSCTASKQNHDYNKITAINYIVNLPIVQEGGQLFNLNDTMPISYYQDLILYQLPYEFDSSISTYHVKADTVEEKHFLTTRYNYLVYREGNKYGIWYETIHGKEFKKVSVDSLLSLKGKPVDFQYIVSRPNDTLIGKTILNNGNIFIEKYIHKTKPDESFSDTTLLYYSRGLRDIIFSFSPMLDKMKESKLFKLRLVYNEAYSPKYSIIKPKREISFEVQQIKVSNSEQLIDFFNRFVKDEKALF